MSSYALGKIQFARAPLFSQRLYKTEENSSPPKMTQRVSSLIN